MTGLFGVASGAGSAAQDHITKRLVLDLVMASMYVVLPVLWTGMAGWAGFKVDTVLRSSDSMGKSTANAGGAVSGMLQRFIRVRK